MMCNGKQPLDLYLYHVYDKHRQKSQAWREKVARHVAEQAELSKQKETVSNDEHVQTSS